MWLTNGFGFSFVIRISSTFVISLILYPELSLFNIVVDSCSVDGANVSSVWLWSIKEKTVCDGFPTESLVPLSFGVLMRMFCWDGGQLSYSGQHLPLMKYSRSQFTRKWHVTLLHDISPPWQ